MSDLNASRHAICQHALTFIEQDQFIGVGSGSTVSQFIPLLAPYAQDIRGIVPASKQSEALLREYHLPIASLSDGDLALYFDSADAFNNQGVLIKGGGGAMTQEKVLAYHAERFIVMVDEAKRDNTLSEHPIPIEVLSMAKSAVARTLFKTYRANPVYREHAITDNGHMILDVYDLPTQTPMKLSRELNQIPGIVGHGLFATRTADTCIVGDDDHIDVFEP